MSVPSYVIVKVAHLVAKSAQTAFRGSTIIRKTDLYRLDEYVIKIIRRNTLGADGAVSQIIKIAKGNKKEAIWHMVTKAGRIIHKHLE